MSPTKKKIWGAPRLSVQSDRVSILGVGTSSLFMTGTDVPRIYTLLLEKIVSCTLTGVDP
jgi:hypothetical protein